MELLFFPIFQAASQVLTGASANSCTCSPRNRKQRCKRIPALLQDPGADGKATEPFLAFPWICFYGTAAQASHPTAMRELRGTGLEIRAVTHPSHIHPLPHHSHALPHLSHPPPDLSHPLPHLSHPLPPHTLLQGWMELSCAFQSPELLCAMLQAGAECPVQAAVGPGDSLVSGPDVSQKSSQSVWILCVTRTKIV